jgi:hypothetical protein
MIGYATATGTRRNLEAMRSHGWRVLMTPDTHDRRLTPAGMRYALDNGAWGAHQRGAAFDVAAFDRMRAAWQSDADWIVLPDIVAGGLASLDFSLTWKGKIETPRLQLIAVQDGMTPEWKLDTLTHWGKLARRRGCYLHVARVNTVRRIIRCQDAGADSFDGTSVSRFAVNTPRLTAAIRQGYLFHG